MTFNRVFNFEKNRSLNNLPNLSNPIISWSVPLQVIKITQSIVDGDKVETQTTINFQGVVDTIKDEDLQFKPENLRSFIWYRIYVVNSSVNLTTGDKIIFNNQRFKVMGVKNLSLYGYLSYDVCQDYYDEDEI